MSLCTFETNGDGRVIKLDVNSGVYTMEMWVCLDETGPVFELAGTVSGSSVTNKPVRPRTQCSRRTGSTTRSERRADPT